MRVIQKKMDQINRLRGLDWIRWKRESERITQIKLDIDQGRKKYRTVQALIDDLEAYPTKTASKLPSSFSVTSKASRASKASRNSRGMSLKESQLSRRSLMKAEEEHRISNDVPASQLSTH